MGITIHYRGRMADLDRVEELEDRVIDMALEIGGSVHVWRSWPNESPERVVRGLMLNLVPGQETISLLISPEGWLVPLHEIEASENGELTDPTCWVKTQFGSIEGHVAVVELFDFLKREFFPDLYVMDEGEYWETRDLKRLTSKMTFLGGMIKQFAKTLRDYPLSAEAAEDSDILVARIERVAQLVQQSLARPPEHPPVQFNDEESEWDEIDESQWDEFYKEQRRKQEGLHRAIEEQRRAGVDSENAFENAMRNEGLIDLPGEPESDNQFFDDELDEWDGHEWENESSSIDEIDSSDSPDDPFELDRSERHPLQQAASDLWLRASLLLKENGKTRCDQVDVLLNGIGELTGGLEQALMDGETGLDRMQRGLAIVQLKRALRGTAFASGALFPLRDMQLLAKADFDDFHERLDKIRTQVCEVLNRFRQAGL